MGFIMLIIGGIIVMLMYSLFLGAFLSKHNVGKVIVWTGSAAFGLFIGAVATGSGFFESSGFLIIAIMLWVFGNGLKGEFPEDNNNLLK